MPRYVIKRTEAFKKWLYGLKDRKAFARIEARVKRIECGNFGDWRPVGGEVREMRIDCGGGYRLYYIVRGNAVVFFLNGGTKNTQEADIAKAQKMAREI